LFAADEQSDGLATDDQPDALVPGCQSHLFVSGWPSDDLVLTTCGQLAWGLAGW